MTTYGVGELRCRRYCSTAVLGRKDFFKRLIGLFFRIKCYDWLMQRVSLLQFATFVCSTAEL